MCSLRPLLPKWIQELIVLKHSESSCHAAGQNSALFIDQNISLGHFHPSWGDQRGTTAHAFAVFLAWTQLLIKVWLDHKPSTVFKTENNVGQLNSSKDWVIRVCVGFSFFFFLGFSPPSFVRSGIPYVPLLARRPRNPPSGFLVAPAGSRQLKMVKREERQCVGQGNKLLVTPVIRPGRGGRGKGNINHQFLPNFHEERKCLI